MTRLDVYLAKNGFADSREKAKRLIADGKVLVGGKTCLKPAFSVEDGTDITLVCSDTDSYVGRGALKLLKAFEVFPISVKGRTCADIGASTGGFTQVLLENGAEFVYAVDVGHGQLDRRISENPRVKNCEGVNVRFMPPDFFHDDVSFMCCDLSFISLTQTLPAMSAALSDGGQLVALIKPQFEAGRAALNKKGIVKDRKKHVEILSQLCEFFSTVSLSLKGLDFSPVCGGDGNIEYLAFLEKNGGIPRDFDIKKIVDAAFENSKVNP
jgi:23S rRNA (cytidine1920-2'-O)/16S rRNA (cytidine1409-2'-O)-methyltransferase